MNAELWIYHRWTPHHQVVTWEKSTQDTPTCKCDHVECLYIFHLVPFDYSHHYRTLHLHVASPICRGERANNSPKSCTTRATMTSIWICTKYGTRCIPLYCVSHWTFGRIFCHSIYDDWFGCCSFWFLVLKWTRSSTCPHIQYRWDYRAYYYTSCLSLAIICKPL